MEKSIDCVQTLYLVFWLFPCESLNFIAPHHSVEPKPFSVSTHFEIESKYHSSYGIAKQNENKIVSMVHSGDLIYCGGWNLRGTFVFCWAPKPDQGVFEN